MNLPQTYAKLIQGIPAEEARAFVPKLVAYMKSRGHLSLLPHVLRILDREPKEKNAAVVTVAKESDSKKFASRVKEALALLKAEDARAVTLVDPKAVGGFSVRAGGRLIDRTFRTGLVSIYKNAVSK